MATLRGTRKSDLLRGGDEDDRIFGFGGPDQLTGKLGDDRIFGGGGRDRIGGGQDDDLIRGGRGSDVIDGGAGDDDIGGGRGADRIDGGSGANVLNGGRGADRFIYGVLDDEVDRITDFDPSEEDELRLTGELTGAAVRMIDDGTDTTVRVRTADSDDFVDLAVLEGFRQPIDVWHGDHQQFGDPGEAQRWVNILGNVATDGLTALTYSLNDGPDQALTVGPNGSRLEELGDFNVEIDYSELDPSAADDVVSIHARYDNGQLFTHDVTVAYEDGQVWPDLYSIDWSEVTDLQEVVQVVDGLWTFDENGVRPALPGYDRVLALGETTWDNYEVQLTLTINDFSEVVNFGAIWFGMQWGGHTDNPAGGQPHLGYIPGATFMMNGAVVLRPTEFVDNDVNPRFTKGLPLADGDVLNILIRTEHVLSDTDLSDGLDRTYSFKAWGIDQPEPADWYIRHTFVDQEPFGSFYLNAHKVDVTFGDLTVTQLDESDLLAAADSFDELLAPAAAEDVPVSGAAVAAAEAPAANLASLVTAAEEPAVAA